MLNENRFLGYKVKRKNTTMVGSEVLRSQNETQENKSQKGEGNGQ